MTLQKVHWSFWVISAIALIWHVMGSMNFVMQMNPDMLSNYSEAAQTFINNRPVWATAGFAIAVFGGSLASILLIRRNGDLAYLLFVMSLLGVILTNVHTLQANVGNDIILGSVMSLVVAIIMIGYVKFAQQKLWIK